MKLTAKRAPRLPDRNGHFGRFGGRFVPETLMAALEELTRGILLRHYPSIPRNAVRLVLVGSAD